MIKPPVATVVGVGPGLGTALVRRFNREGFAVAALARNAANLEPVANEERVLAVTADATDASSLETAFASIREQLGDIDVLVYNAGAFTMAGILDIDPELFEESWRANCHGAFLAARQVLPAMLEKKNGTILMTGATASLRGSARFACLAVGKFGLRALAQSMAREFGPQGIHVAHVIIDGMIATPRVRAMVPDKGDDALLDPDGIAEAYWQLHQQPATTWTLESDLRPSVEQF